MLARLLRRRTSIKTTMGPCLLTLISLLDVILLYRVSLSVSLSPANILSGNDILTLGQRLKQQ